MYDLIRELPEDERDPWFELERKLGIFQHGRREGREEGLQEGRREGLQEGRREGLQTGRQALVQLIFDLLGERGVEIDDVNAARIRECERLEVLQRWARRSAAANHVTDLFEG